MVNSYPSREKEHVIYHVSVFRDSSYYKSMRGPDYYIMTKDSSEIYRSRRQTHEIMYDPVNRIYTLVHKRNKEIYRLRGNEIFLGRNYLIRQNETRKLIEIRRSNGNQRLIYTIQSGNNSLYVFNKNHCGWKLETRGDSLILYAGVKPVKEYTLKH